MVRGHGVIWEMSAKMKKAFWLILGPLVAGVILGELEFQEFRFNLKPLPAALGIALCLFVLVAGAATARLKFGRSWLPLGWTLVVIFALVVILSLSDLSWPSFMTSNISVINTSLLIIVLVLYLIRARKRQ
jgi:hypothetical protein